jgi:uncharacterized membrane protein
MIWLGLSILFSSILYVIFKLFTRFKVNTLQAIVVNYAVATCTGIYMSDNPVNLNEIKEAAWLPWALFMGLLFISIFNIMALTAQRNGLSVAAVAGKMSLVIPVTIGFVAYNETAGWIKILGICIALLAVYFTTTRNYGLVSKPFEIKNLLFPGILFLGSGVIDSILKHIEINFMKPELEATISATIFCTALLAGLTILVRNYFTQGTRFEFKSILAGMVLGIPNYFSIIFIFKALAANDEASFVYPVNHVGTILLSTMLGLLLFKERLQVRNWIGILLAVGAISLIAFAKA